MLPFAISYTGPLQGFKLVECSPFAALIFIMCVFMCLEYAIIV